MRIRFELIALLILLYPGLLIRTSLARPKIDSPQAGEALQGKVAIIGSTHLIGFRSYEIAYSYNTEELDTWFLILQSQESVASGKLAVWDTTTITDGNYRLRLQIFLDNAQVEEVIIPGLRVRNYTPIETVYPSTPQPFITSEPTLTPAPTFTPKPLPSPLPANPARITSRALVSSLYWGIGFVLLLFLGITIYLGLRSTKRRR